MEKHTIIEYELQHNVTGEIHQCTYSLMTADPETAIDRLEHTGTDEEHTLTVTGYQVEQ